MNWQPCRIVLLFVGSEWARRKLAIHDEATARSLIPLEVEAWSRKETAEYYFKTFAVVGMTIDEVGLELMTDFADGLPLFAHEIGEVAFQIASGPVISE